MRKALVIGLLFFAGTPLMTGSGHGALAPHNTTNSISCFDCHNITLAGENSDPTVSPFRLVNCAACHNNDSGGNYSREQAPAVETHSAENIGSTRYGTWGRDCKDCHGHDNQTPLANGLVSDPVVNSETKTTTFTMEKVTITDTNWQNLGSLAAPANWGNKSTAERGLIITVTIPQPQNGTQPGAPMPIGAEIISATENSITVKGEFPQLEQKDFTLEYGQLLKSYVLVPGEETLPDGKKVPTLIQKEVNFDSPAEFAFNDGFGETDPVNPVVKKDSTPDGVCQVCHTKTSHWRSDGGGGDHYNGEQCTKCHDHTKGFRPRCDSCHGFPPVVAEPRIYDGLVAVPYPTGSMTAGQHQKHYEQYKYLGSKVCDLCHAEGMPATPIINNFKIQIGFDTFGHHSAITVPKYEGQTLDSSYAYDGTQGTEITTPEKGGTGSMRCSNVYCHSPARTPALGWDMPSTSPSWDGTDGDRQGNNFTCDNCHGYPPQFDSHMEHWQMGEINHNCGICHYATTQDGVTISNPTLHANGVYDVLPAPGFMLKGGWRSLDFNYVYKPNGGTCFNNSCHMYARSIVKLEAQWFVEAPIIMGKFNYQERCNSQGSEVEVQVTIPTFPKYVGPYTYQIKWGDGTMQEEINCCDHTPKDYYDPNDPNDAIDTCNPKAPPCAISHTYSDGLSKRTVGWRLYDSLWSATSDDLEPAAVINNCPAP